MSVASSAVGDLPKGVDPRGYDGRPRGSLFTVSDRARRLRDELLDFTGSSVYPAEPAYAEQMRVVDPHHHPAVLEDLKSRARRGGLWTLFHPDPRCGAGLSDLEYAPLAEIMGAARYSRPRRATATHRTPETWWCFPGSAAPSTRIGGCGRCWTGPSGRRSR
jgi:hypothetical protein